ncbi:DUF2461 domain-containing protein [Marinilongibacter aquaticus]|uniref:DUF2461 domain-containing protein n=1 Tax=Marinilongibacter aquaticus TaxID=2975157 RepID=UPI0021BD33C4|nr:DUF2461 domain-containing protein [Marinilongibacter aquaticus]UBM59071.1 DUF2461 domain-containing protein [Marinilongibacter aquaticus]
MKHVFPFLRALQENNHREWFEAHRDQYQAALDEMIELAEHIRLELMKYDEIETPSGKKSLMRIYRDIRFSKDKTPYKTNWAGSFKRATKEKRGGYYFHIQEGQCFLAGGFWGPSSDDLKQIREHIAEEGDELLDIIESSAFKAAFGELKGDKLKKAPKGFSPDNPYIELLKYKQFLLIQPIENPNVPISELAEIIAKGFVEMRPFFDLMSAFLTTDMNGIPLDEAQ